MSGEICSKMGFNPVPSPLQFSTGKYIAKEIL